MAYICTKKWNHLKNQYSLLLTYHYHRPKWQSCIIWKVIFNILPHHFAIKICFTIFSIVIILFTLVLSTKLFNAIHDICRGLKGSVFPLKDWSFIKTKNSMLQKVFVTMKKNYAGSLHLQSAMDEAPVSMELVIIHLFFSTF